ncbi:fibrobacter succinogenes major paralogous domain-containing protein [Fibrobacter sp.]|uniref:fibrobacter succinogenes major paralogous domain-containing protein n=1 Tax=Fibrobacter sp. TaxID=35828 RepID=UPI0026082EFD|nr:fibrobacter succinogenes major paralogous domain-containing protein [Fibrobacter sp.]MDD5943195.1 fibrobacter succinogenes major paralogous domain-containing protein [Fibrobacter sp.]
MKNPFSKKFTVCALAGVLGAAFIGCGDDGSSSPKGTGLPAEVGDMAELETYECGMDVIGEKVYVIELEENYECDGEKWFKSYDQTKPSSTKSSGSKDTDGSSDSRATDKDGSSSDATTSSSSAKSSSSRPTEILEPEITVNETCTEVGACDAMVKTDVSTWHFVRKDDFGDDAEYTYTVDGKDLIITIKNADGSIDSKTYSMYNMESEAGVEMAFNAAKSTCKNGGGNDNKVKNCVKDTVKTLPKEAYLNPELEYGTMTDERDGQVYRTTTIGNQVWMAENLNYADSVTTPSLKGKSWCFKNCDVAGRLYTWAAAIDSVTLYNGGEGVDCGHGKTCSLPTKVQGICPSGWHLPTKAEFKTLIDAVGGQSTAGKMLKSTSGWNDYNGDSGNGTDVYGFSALPAGNRKFYNKGNAAFFWSASENDSYDACYMYLAYDYDDASLYDDFKFNGYSVRCLKDSD